LNIESNSDEMNSADSLEADNLARIGKRKIAKASSKVIVKSCSPLSAERSRVCFA
jgi:hypothetical protein